MYCGKKIAKGECYSRETGIYGGDFNDYCLCERCRNVIVLFKEPIEYELGSFFDDLENTGILDCPKCKTSNMRNHTMSSDRMSIEVECRKCDCKHVVDLSENNISNYFRTNKCVK